MAIHRLLASCLIIAAWFNVYAQSMAIDSTNSTTLSLSPSTLSPPSTSASIIITPSIPSSMASPTRSPSPVSTTPKPLNLLDILATLTGFTSCATTCLGSLFPLIQIALTDRITDACLDPATPSTLENCKKTCPDDLSVFNSLQSYCATVPTAAPLPTARIAAVKSGTKGQGSPRFVFDADGMQRTIDTESYNHDPYHRHPTTSSSMPSSPLTIRQHTPPNPITRPTSQSPTSTSSHIPSPSTAFKPYHRIQRRSYIAQIISISLFFILVDTWGPTLFSNAQLVITVTAPASTVTVTAPAASPTATCPGFGGQDCLQPACLNDESCATPFGSSEKAVCNRQAKVWKAGTSYCDLKVPLLEAVYPGTSKIMIHRNVTAGYSLGSLWYDDRQQFMCRLSNCTQSLTERPRVYSWSCTETKCECTPGSTFCGGPGVSVNLGGPIASASGKLKFTCPVNLRGTVDGECSATSLALAGLGYAMVMQARARRRPVPPPRKGATIRVTGAARAGRVLAIMGPSGKNKSGNVTGRVTIDGQDLPPAAFKSVVGYVDQDDLLMPTLTVRETLMFSATLRLPESVSHDEKRERLCGIGNVGKGCRGISGGERRRVSIGVELVTSPAVILLDEPTSGLDSYNAHSVVKTLADLAKSHGKTVAFTIHQPRSDLFGVFDDLLVLSGGQVLYCGNGWGSDELWLWGEFEWRRAFGSRIGEVVPSVVQGNGDSGGGVLRNRFGNGGAKLESTSPSSPGQEKPFDVKSGCADEFLVATTTTAAPLSADAIALVAVSGPTPNVLNRNESDMDGAGNTIYSPSIVEQNSSAVLIAVEDQEQQVVRPASRPASTRRGASGQPPSPSQAAILPVTAVSSSSSASTVGTVASVAVPCHERHPSAGACANSRSPSACPTEGEVSVGAVGIISKSHEVGFMTQLCALMGRAARNLYRNLGLLVSHMVLAIVLGVFVGMLYYKSGNSLGGIQNRLGSLVFLLALLGFSGISAIGSFAGERALYVRERASGFYGTMPLFLTKLVFDTFALRILPAFVMGTITFVLIGLSSEGDRYVKFLVVVLLFSAEIGLLCLAFAVAVPDVGTATLVAAIVILFKMLFAGLLINQDNIPGFMKWIQYGSFFRFSYEALIVNDIVGIKIVDTIAGASVNIPATIILQRFGFDIDAYYRDLFVSVGLTVMLLVLVYVMLAWRLREMR
ncbi:hypothetical protein BC829DRAFT_446307 [Chytridium lagenaria]|nr:hypothetical protein BC829DRAFT_446307 [Chytridium lagenaria]